MKTRTSSIARTRQPTAGDSKLARGKITKPAVTPRTVSRRARELALIAGRSTRSAVSSDRHDAKAELTGPIHPTPSRKHRDLDTAQWDPAPVSTGKRVRRILPTDDRTTERLVEEGVDEAEHDEMLQARKSRTVLDE